MEEEKKDVTPDPSAGTEEVVNTEQETTPEPETQVEEDASTQEVKPEVKDDRPIENVAWETKRKIDELSPKVDKLFELIQQQGQIQPQQPQYSKAQLQAYASDPSTTTEQRLWAYTEVDKMEKLDRAREYENLVKTTQTQSQAEARRTQSAQWVAQTFPETVVKDNMGNVMGWNNQSPLMARANEYMGRNENLRKDPEGFTAAIKMAAFDLGVSMNLSNKVNKTIGQLRKEQKKQLASAGGTRTAETPEKTSKTRIAKLQEEYRKTGNKDIFAEIIKLKGLNPFV